MIPYQIFPWHAFSSADTSRQMPGIGFLNFFQCRWQHSKAHSFTCHCWLFFLAGLPAHIAPGEERFVAKSQERYSEVPFTVCILATRVVWPTMRWTFVNLSPRDASLFAKKSWILWVNIMLFCQVKRSCFGGSPGHQHHLTFVLILLVTFVSFT